MHVEALQSHIDRGFEHLTARLDDQRDVSSTRHAENVKTLASIKSEARQTAAQVTEAHRKLATQEEQIKTLYRLVQARTPATGDAENVTLGRLKWYLAIYGSGVGTALAIFKLLGKI